MPNEEREKEILTILEKKYMISVKELADLLFVSEPTIRRDLSGMEKKQLILRTHGKVIANKISANTNMALSAREQHMYNIKSNLAEKAASLVNDGDVIMLDASSTASHLIQRYHRNHLRNQNIVHARPNRYKIYLHRR